MDKFRRKKKKGLTDVDIRRERKSKQSCNYEIHPSKTFPSPNTAAQTAPGGTVSVTEKQAGDRGEGAGELPPSRTVPARPAPEGSERQPSRQRGGV